MKATYLLDFQDNIGSATSAIVGFSKWSLDSRALNRWCLSTKHTYDESYGCYRTGLFGNITAKFKYADSGGNQYWISPVPVSSSYELVFTVSGGIIDFGYAMLFPYHHDAEYAPDGYHMMVFIASGSHVVGSMPADNLPNFHTYKLSDPWIDGSQSSFFYTSALRAKYHKQINICAVYTVDNEMSAPVNWNLISGLSESITTRCVTIGYFDGYSGAVHSNSSTFEPWLYIPDSTAGDEFEETFNSYSFALMASDVITNSIDNSVKIGEIYDVVINGGGEGSSVDLSPLDDKLNTILAYAKKK